jgi:hypothetical protein
MLPTQIEAASKQALVGEKIKSAKRKGLSERDAVLVSLRNKKVRPEKTKKGSATIASPSSEEKFPYGTRIHVDGDHAKSLGLHKAKAGQKISGKFKGHVTSVSKDHREGEAPTHRAEVQITHMSPVEPDSFDDPDGEDQD